MRKSKLNLKMTMTNRMNTNMELNISLVRHSAIMSFQTIVSALLIVFTRPLLPLQRCVGNAPSRPLEAVEGSATNWAPRMQPALW